MNAAQPLQTEPDNFRLIERALNVGDFDTREQSEARQTGLQALRALRITEVALGIGAKELVRLLLKHGRHTDDCMSHINGSCYCGWEELKPKLKKGLVAQ